MKISIKVNDYKLNSKIIVYWSTGTDSNKFLFSLKNIKGKMFHKGLTASKSSPNLIDDAADRGRRCSSPLLFMNKSTEYANSPPLNPHKALIDLYNKYAGNKGDTFRRAFSLRPRKMKNIDDIFKYCNEENTFSVKIRKGSHGLGLCIYGGKDSSRRDPFHQLIRISNLHPLQPALESGKLTLGDVILAVNGTSTLGMTNLEAIEVLRNSPADVELKVFRPAKYLLPSFPECKENVCSENSSCRSVMNGNSCADKSYNNAQSGEITVTLTKKDGCLGFSIIREGNAKDLIGGIFIKALTRQHAIENGKIKVGDRILQVNGREISGFSLAEAIYFLRKAPETVILKLCRNCNENNYCQKHSKPEVHTFNVILEKTNERLGFLMWNSIDSNADIKRNMLPCAAEVKVVYTGSLAEKNGIKVGDRILEINGESVLGKTADEVNCILRKTEGVIRMVFCRL